MHTETSTPTQVNEIGQSRNYRVGLHNLGLLQYMSILLNWSKNHIPQNLVRL